MTSKYLVLYPTLYPILVTILFVVGVIAVLWIWDFLSTALPRWVYRFQYGEHPTDTRDRRRAADARAIQAATGGYAAEMRRAEDEKRNIERTRRLEATEARIKKAYASLGMKL